MYQKCSKILNKCIHLFNIFRTEDINFIRIKSDDKFDIQHSVVLINNTYTMRFILNQSDLKDNKIFGGSTKIYFIKSTSSTYYTHNSINRGYKPTLKTIYIKPLLFNKDVTQYIMNNISSSRETELNCVFCSEKINTDENYISNYKCKHNFHVECIIENEDANPTLVKCASLTCKEVQKQYHVSDFICSCETTISYDRYIFQ